MRAAFEARWPGSVGIELAGMVGSVETPTVYQPEATQVLRLPGPFHGVSGNPDGCSSVYPEPSTGTPVANAREFIPAYGHSVADAAAAALASSGRTSVPTALASQHASLCVQLENNLFVAAAAAGLFPDRPLYGDPGCSVGAPLSAAARAPAGTSTPSPPPPTWIKTDVGVVTLGPAQLAYSPGEVFPFTEIRGAIDAAQMPFPTNCYDPSTSNFYCGTPLPMTQWVSAEMNRPYRFLVGLGEDMIGYMFPPGNFVGTQGEVDQEPWLAYENASQNGGHDRFGYGHADDAESAGPHAGLAVTSALQELLASTGTGSQFPAGAFTGAVGVEVLRLGEGSPRTVLMGRDASAWATFDALRDTGTAGTSLPYSVRTGGVILNSGQPLLVDVFAGARALGL
jgi:hypothetical protein